MYLCKIRQAFIKVMLQRGFILTPSVKVVQQALRDIH